MVNGLQSALGLVKHLLPVSTVGPLPLLPRLPDVPSFLRQLTALLAGKGDAAPAPVAPPAAPSARQDPTEASTPEGTQVVTAVELAKIREFLLLFREGEAGRAGSAPPNPEPDGFRMARALRAESPDAAPPPALPPTEFPRVQVPYPAPPPPRPEAAPPPAVAAAAAPILPESAVRAVAAVGPRSDAAESGPRDPVTGRRSAGVPSRVHFLLEPDALGPVEVDLALEADGLHAALRTDSAPARDVLASRLDVLRAALERLRFQVRELRVSGPAADPRSGDPQGIDVRV